MSDSRLKHSRRSLWLASGALLCVAAAGCFATAGDDAVLSDQASTATMGDAAVSVRDGRLLFPDVQAFGDVVRALQRDNGRLDLAHFEKRFAGFSSLATATDKTLAIPTVLQVIMNHEGSYQIKDEIFLLSGDDEYILPEAEAGLIAELASGASAKPYIDAGRIRVATRTRVTSNQHSGFDFEGTGPAPLLLDAKYQYQFSDFGHTYKFVDEAYVDVYSTYVNSCFRAKFEYKDGRKWKSAGEKVYKQIYFAYVKYDNGHGSVVDSGPLDGTRNDSSHLTVCTLIIPAPGTCFTAPKLRANYDSEATSGAVSDKPYEYSVSAEWNTEFIGINKCN